MTTVALARNTYYQLGSAASAAALLLPRIASGAVYSGDGVASGVGSAAGAVGGTSALTFRETAVNAIKTATNYMGLASVIVLVIAGIMLIVGLGSDDSREKAKKIVLFTIIGLILIIFARAIVILVETGTTTGPVTTN